MKALNDLRRFILAKSSKEEVHEVRDYVRDNIEELARDFCVTTGTILTALENTPDDSSLACRLLETIHRSKALHDSRRKEARAKAAQASADALASMARWEGDQAHVDIISVLASALTKRNDLLVFACDDFSVGIYMAPLFDIAKLKKRDLTAFVDAKGLHIRWTTGAINLFPQIDAEADRVIMCLPAKVAAAAA